MLYNVVHTYLTTDLEGKQAVDVMEYDKIDTYDLAAFLKNEIEYPGGVSGTTISLSVTLVMGQDVRI